MGIFKEVHEIRLITNNMIMTHVHIFIAKRKTKNKNTCLLMIYEKNAQYTIVPGKYTMHFIIKPEDHLYKKFNIQD